MSNPQSTPRLDAIRKILQQRPEDAFARYGLAMELKNLGRLDEAHAEFEALTKTSPEYVPQYLMHINVLAALKRKDDAKAVGARGLEAARKKGDFHALGELQDAIDSLDNAD